MLPHSLDLFVHGRRGAHVGLQLQGWTESPGHVRLGRDSVETVALTMSIKKTLENRGSQHCSVNTDQEIVEKDSIHWFLTHLIIRSLGLGRKTTTIA